MSRSPLMRRAGLAVLVACLSVALPHAAWSWGGPTHHYIAEHYSQHLPGTIDGLRAYDSVVDQHVTDPDTRKSTTPGESYRHFIDIDAYPEFLAGTLTHSRSALESEYGASTVLANGVLPWIEGDVVNTLAQQFRARQWSAAALTIADLCHYAGDATQPLHCTENYDGQLSGNSGVHSRYESTMLEPYLSGLSTPVMPVRYYAGVIDTMFRVVGDSWADVATILQADNDALDRSSGQYDADYYNVMWSETGAMTRARIDSATVLTASLVYTAWVNAGEPAVPGSTSPVEPGAPAGNRLSAWPSPFRDQLNLQYAGSGPLRVEVFDVHGARVAELADAVPSAGSLSWRPADAGHRIEAGLYFVRLSGPGWNMVRRITFLN